MTEEVPSVTLTGEQVMQWEQWQKKKTSESTTGTSSQGPIATAATHFGNIANYAHVGKGT